AAAPELAVVADVTDGDERTLTLRLTSPRGASTIGLWVDETTAAVRETVVAGRSAAPAAPFGFLFSGTPAEGIEVRLAVAPRDGAVVLHVADAPTTSPWFRDTTLRTTGRWSPPRSR
ncbi:hypothetical protein GQ85_36100, partial [Rhodococcus rhodochrous]